MDADMIERVIMEVRELLKIPNVDKALCHRIEACKLILAKNIDFYREAEQVIQPKKKKIYDQGISFEIIRIGKKLWIPAIPGMKDINVYEYIPQEVVDYIVASNTKPGIIEMKTGLKFPGQKGKIYNISFEKHNSRSFTGIIEEIEEKDRSIKTWEYPGNHPETKIEDLKLLFHYLMEYPHYFEKVFREFKMVWKSKLDSNRMVK